MTFPNVKFNKTKLMFNWFSILDKITSTVISKKVFIVNSRYWKRKELWVSSSTSNLLLLALTLQNIVQAHHITTVIQ